MNPVAAVCFVILALGLADGSTIEDRQTYDHAAAVLGRDADAHVRLASWCETHGLTAERHKHLAIALEIDPANALAHGLLGQLADRGEWRMPEVVIDDRRNDKAAAATLAQYHARRDKVPDTAQAHRQLAGWCDDNGLKAEARAHWTAVVRLNPANEEAWKKLGYHRQKGRWALGEMTTLVRAEAEAQRRADARWRPLFQKWNGWLERKTRHAEAEAALADVHDPRAVPSIWKVFIAGGATEQERAVRLLGQIDAPAASRALASLAVVGSNDDVRAGAAAVLLRRDPREFTPFLISLLRDPIQYEVRPVEGPGKPGELYVHGERTNRRFFYAAPPPLTTIRPTDIVGFDDYGMPVATRIVGYTGMPVAAAIDPLLAGAPDLTGAPEILGRAFGPAGTQLGQQMLANQQLATQIGASMGFAGVPQMAAMPQQFRNSLTNSSQGAGSGPSVMTPLTAQVPVGRLMMQAEQQAAQSRTQLQEDVAALDRYNADVKQVNDRATAALETALMENHGPQRAAWVKWWSSRAESFMSAAPATENKGPEASQAAVENRAILPAFAAETSLWTLSGLQPIEAIRTGDQVLTQDTATGTLAFAPVLTIHPTQHQLVKKITFGDTPVIATDLERFWVPGKGWTTVLDLKAGNPVRALGDLVQVASIEDAGVRTVYHVQVTAGRGIIVSQRGLLAHDERIAFPAPVLFDSATIAGNTQASSSIKAE